MKISFRTRVNQPIHSVWQGFDQSLFVKLSPPFPSVRLLRFDGSLPNNEVHLELNFLLFKQRWISRITAQQEAVNEIFFVDEGVQLPFFLHYWHHKHSIVADGSGSSIIDEITFKTYNHLTDYLFYPLFYAQFAYRKPIYRKHFA